jgi:hypothetical protein
MRRGRSQAVVATADANETLLVEVPQSAGLWLVGPDDEVPNA